MPCSAGVFYTVSQRGKPSSQPLLLIHGAGGMGLSWPPQLRRLPDTTVLVPDLPNHGKSAPRGYQNLEQMASIILEWLDVLNVVQVDCCGHSMGGAISLLLALQAPQRVQKLILIGSAARLVVNPNLLELASKVDTLPLAVELLIKWSFAPNTPRRLKELTARRLLENHPATLYQDLFACNQFDLSPKLSQIQQQTLMITGEHDKMTPITSAQWLVTNLPNARLEIIPATGHMVVLEQPDLLARKIWEFIRLN